MNTELIQPFNELTLEASNLHDRVTTDLTLASPEQVEGAMQERRESNMRLRELTFRLDREIQQLGDMKKIVRIKQGWNTSDLNSLDAYRWYLVNERKQQRA